MEKTLEQKMKELAIKKLSEGSEGLKPDNSSINLYLNVLYDLWKNGLLTEEQVNEEIS